MNRLAISTVMMAVLAASGNWALAQATGAGGAAGAGEDKSAPLVIPDDSGSAVRKYPEMPKEMQKLHEQMQALRAEGGPLNPEQVRKLQERLAQELAAAPGIGGTMVVPRVTTMELRREKAAFLGITTSAVTPTLREQLKIDKGVGLVVDFVEKDSPADAAGIKVHDILTKLDDQILINSQQLAVLVRSKKGGDSITLMLLHEGKTTTATAKLVEKDLPVLEESNPWLVPDRKFFTVPVPGDRAGAVGPDGATWKKSQRVTLKANADGTTVKTLSDDAGTLTMTTGVDGKSTLVATDKDGKELFSGPVDTEEQKAKLPGDVGERLKKMNANMDAGKLRGEAESRIGGTVGGVRVEGKGTTLEAQSITLARGDEEHVITLSIKGSGGELSKSLVVKDAKTGKVIFEGPVNTEAERKGLPEGVVKKLEGLEGKVGK